MIILLSDWSLIGQYQLRSLITEQCHCTLISWWWSVSWWLTSEHMWLWQYHHCCDKCLRSILCDYTNKTLWWESISVSLVLSPLMVSRYWSKHNVTLSDSITHCLRSYHWPEYCDQETMIPWAPLCLCCHQRLQCPLSQMMVTTDSLQQFCTIFAHVCTSVASISGVQYLQLQQS